MLWCACTTLHQCHNEFVSAFAAGDIVRLVPPLIVSEEDIQKCATLVAAAIEAVMPR